ncbi:TetR/AcrR family transcriptional regulator [Frankia sp. Cj3]|uniref:TetR/AcrR family transcriptional regulator n=2 Tax=Frankia TaxID=1854 RepID=UPI001EF4D8F6|nr:TetR/AcrR family transcriptional regulator [Frankia sp. Cj3]
MEEPTPRRRDRLRAETVREIKMIALKHMAAGGAATVSLRAIAREMGMTAGALYSYYDTRDDLVIALIADVYGQLAELLDMARTTRPADDPGAQLLAVGLAYRQWAINNTGEFQLVYGDPLPGCQAPEGAVALAAEYRACGVLLKIVAAAWPAVERSQAIDDYRWSDFDPAFVAMVGESFPELPPSAVALSLRIWGRLHGLIALEVYGHLRPQILDPAKLYHAELVDLTRTLGHASPIRSSA